MKHWKAYLLVCVALLLSGCSGGQTGGAHAKASPTATMSPPTPTPLTVNLTPLSMQQAWGNIKMSQFSLDMGDRYFSPTGSEFNGITDDGQVCGSTWLMRSQSVNLSKVIESVGLMDLHTGHIALFATMPAGYYQVACTVTGSWVIWTQTPGSNVASAAAHWVIKAFNRQTGDIRQLDQGHGPSGQQPYTSIQPQPYASNGRVVWTTYSQDTPGKTQSEIYTFATGKKTVLAPLTGGPRISWPWVSWGDGDASAVVFENLETGQQVRLPMSYAPTTVAFAGTSYVYTNSDYSQVTLVPSILAQPITSYVVEDKQADGGDFNEFPTLNDRLVTWQGPNVWLVFDRKLQRPVKIAIGVNGLNGFVSSHYLVATPALTQADWDAQSHGLPYNAVMLVIDTNTLP
ncbi:MAG TPA: hypothetical protein VGF38_04750 [Ktedonobacterales bacterium]